MSYKGFAEPRHLITPADLKARLDEVALIDVRAAHDYATGHIEGTAWPAPLMRSQSENISVGQFFGTTWADDGAFFGRL